MNKETRPPVRPQKNKSGERQNNDRLKAALKENIRRRKMQLRAQKCKDQKGLN